MSGQTVVRSGPEAVSPASFREALGHFASGLVIVTGMDGDDPCGLTCQSFASLSLDPPLVVFCPSSRSTTWRRLATARRFCINVLGQHQRDLSERFGRSREDKFAGVPWREGRNGSPRLDGAIAHIECDLHSVHPGGDHDIATGAVTDLSVHAQADPLLFFRSAYARLTR
jgi:3-hydroxy-9,10-secoandrosta-1,3,5(10)-triene-9,17-dione monooxygenase reductase component